MPQAWCSSPIFSTLTAPKSCRHTLECHTHSSWGKVATPGSGSVLSLLALGSEEIPSDSTAHLLGIAASCTVASGEGLWLQHDGHLLCNCQLAPSNLAQATCRCQLCQPGMDPKMLLPPWGSSPSSPLLEVVEASTDRFFTLWWSNCSGH